MVILPTNGWDLLTSLGQPSKFKQVSRLGSLTARHSSSGRQPNFTALNRRHHLYLAGRPSCWALHHISSLCWWQLLHQMVVFNIMNFTHEKYNKLLCSRVLRIVPRIFKLRFHRCYFFWWEGGKCTENLLSIMLKLFSYHRHSILSVNFHHLPVHLWNLC